MKPEEKQKFLDDNSDEIVEYRTTNKAVLQVKILKKLAELEARIKALES